MSTLTIRRAALADAEALSRIGIETFDETFGEGYPPEDLASFFASAYGLEKTRRDLSDPNKAAWLVESDGKVVGHALAGPCDLPHPDVTSSCGELKRLYILKAYQGGGTGTRLLNVVFDWLLEKGPRTLWIGVWSENYGAQRLYGRMGFEKVGDYIFPVGDTQDREFILRKL